MLDVEELFEARQVVDVSECWMLGLSEARQVVEVSELFWSYY